MIRDITIECDTRDCGAYCQVSSMTAEEARAKAAERYGWSRTGHGFDHCGPCTRAASAEQTDERTEAHDLPLLEMLLLARRPRLRADRLVEAEIIARVRELAERWAHVSDRQNGPLRELRAALDVNGSGS